MSEKKNKSLRRQEDVRLLDEEVFEEFEDEEDFSESDNFSADDSFDDDDIDDDELYEDEDEEEVPEFKYEEKLPVGIDSHLNLYQYETFCFTNMKVTLKEKKIFKTEDRMLVFY